MYFFHESVNPSDNGSCRCPYLLNKYLGSSAKRAVEFVCLACKFSYGREALPNILTQADIDKARKKYHIFILQEVISVRKSVQVFAQKQFFVGLSALATKLQENEG